MAAIGAAARFSGLIGGGGGGGLAAGAIRVCCHHQPAGPRANMVLLRDGLVRHFRKKRPARGL